MNAELDRIVADMHKVMGQYRAIREGSSRDQIVEAADRMHALAYEVNVRLAEQGMLSKELAAQVPWIGYVPIDGN